MRCSERGRSPIAPAWPRTSESPRIGPAQVDVWCFDLERPPAEVEALGATLNPEEQGRASRFQFEEDRIAFTVARGTVREVLGRYLGQGPQTLRFEYGPQGKPRLAQGGLAFNLAHTGSLALLAVTNGPAVGVDLEWIDPGCPVSDVAKRFFSRDECEVFFSHPEQQRHRTFFTCWTRKEAFIKAAGGGLCIPLDQFDVLWLGLDVARLRQRGTTVPGQWWLADLPSPGEGYAAALVVDLAAPAIQCRSWVSDGG